MVQKEKLVRIALIVSAIGIPLDIISTWWGLSTNPDIRETGTLIIQCINYFELCPGLIIGGIINIALTVIPYCLYKFQKDDGKILWMFSLLRIWVVIGNILLAMRTSILIINLTEYTIILGMCIIIFNLLTSREKA